MTKSKETSTVFAPATVANVAVGFDILGFAIHAIGDEITVSKRAEKGVFIESISANFDSIPTDPSKNTAGMPLIHMLDELKLDFGLSVSIQKGIPLGSGMGGSAASAVGSVVAAQALLSRSGVEKAAAWSKADLLRFALEGEAVASGSKHADNIAPCLLGGLTLSQPGDDPRAVSLPYPRNLIAVVVHPEMRLDTKEARGVLKKDLPLKLHIQQSYRLASFIAGCATSNFELIQCGLEDRVIEPQRAPLIPGFNEVKKAALNAGVFGCSVSGAGPSVFALTTDEKIAEQAKNAMIQAFANAGLKAQGWISLLNAQGATLK